MYTLLFIGAVSFLLALVLTPGVSSLSRRWGLVDHPDVLRKRHTRAVPRLGGVPILASFLGSFGLLFLAASLVGSNGAGIVEDSLPSVAGFLPGVALIFCVGLADDLIGLAPWQKLVGQLAAAGAAYWAGVSVHAIGGHAIPTWWGFPVTVMWLVLCSNSLNLIDGLDGLATGVGLFAASTTLVAALLQGNFPLAVVTIPLVGALLGFLRYNFNPATIFLGDSGSLLIGFLLGSYGVVWSQKSATMLGMTAPMMALSIPLIDTGLSIVRRFLSNKPIFGADRGHIHHRLMDRGMTVKKTVLLLYGLCGGAALLALAMANQRMESMVLIIFCASAWLGIQHLGYVELGVARRMLMGGAFRRHLSAEIALQGLEARLVEAGTPELCWEIISTTSQEFGFCAARMALGGRVFVFGEVLEGVATWQANLPLSERDFVELTRPASNTPTVVIVAPYFEVLSKTLRSKVQTFAQAAAMAAPPRQWKEDRRRHHGYYDTEHRHSYLGSKDVVGR
jgi:UDP-GlcNAc:undecaprenyl-phosphate/decaprenyl-phosphate GlcNAc-1-phosphate transferase